MAKTNNEHVDHQITSVSEVAKQALLNLDASERRIRRWTLAMAVAIFMVTMLLATLVFNYGSEQLNQIHRQQSVLQQESQKVNQSLQILQKATDPKIIAQQHQQTEELIYCLGNLMNADTGHGKLDPSCAVLFVPPPKIPPPTPPVSSTKTTTTTQSTTTTTVKKK